MFKPYVNRLELGEPDLYEGIADQLKKRMTREVGKAMALGEAYGAGKSRLTELLWKPELDPRTRCAPFLTPKTTMAFPFIRSPWEKDEIDPSAGAL